MLDIQLSTCELAEYRKEVAGTTVCQKPYIPGSMPASLSVFVNDRVYLYCRTFLHTPPAFHSFVRQCFTPKFPGTTGEAQSKSKSPPCSPRMRRPMEESPMSTEASKKSSASAAVVGKWGPLGLLARLPGSTLPES